MQAPPLMRPETWVITIKDPDDSVLLLLEWVAPTETILNVKRRLRDALAIPTSAQRLILAGSHLEELQDTRCLSDYHIRGSETLFLVTRPTLEDEDEDEEAVVETALAALLAGKLQQSHRMLLHALYNRPGVVPLRVKTMTGRVLELPVQPSDTLEVGPSQSSPFPPSFVHCWPSAVLLSRCQSPPSILFRRTQHSSLCSSYLPTTSPPTPSPPLPHAVAEVCCQCGGGGGA
jgi:hypothetical protein